MPTPINSFCRLCDGMCGVVAHSDAGRLARLQPDPTDPTSGGFLCATATSSLGALGRPSRITQPMRRVEGRLTPATWDEAIRDISTRLRKLRSQSGASSLGLYLGDEVFRSGTGLVRALAVGVGLGTPNIFSEQCQSTGARLRMAELMVGQALPLSSDLGRSHVLLLLSGNQRQTNWGPHNSGMSHEAAIEHSRKTKGTRVVVADSRATPLAQAMNQHLPIRPGTETFLLLGMLSVAVQSGWVDRQYLRDYTTGFDELEGLLAAWTVERCAEICDVVPAQLSGATLRFCRAAMAVAHPGPSTFASAIGSVGAWAWLALHAVTANLLRPGGLYENTGLFDTHYPVCSVPSSGAPHTRVGDLPLLLLQAPATLLADEVLTPGEGQLRALVCIAGNPGARLPGAPRVRRALSELDLLVCLARGEDETTDHADWVLPLAHPWEREDLHLFNSNLLPIIGTCWTPEVSRAPAEARTEQDILADLFKATRPGLRGSAWGTHLALLGQYLGRADLDAWTDRLLDWVADATPEQLEAPPHRLITGEIDRTSWRVTLPEGRIRLVPDEIRPLLDALRAPEPDPQLPLWLRTSGTVDRAPDRWHRATEHLDPGAAVHPDTGIADGARVRIRTRHGEVVATARHDANLRPDTVDLPLGYTVDAGALLDATVRDPLTGAVSLDGLPCSVTPA